MMRRCISASAIAALLVLAVPAASPATGEPARPDMMSREQWQGKPAVTESMLPISPQGVKGIVIHNTETPHKLWAKKTTAQKMRDIQAFHLTRPHKFRPEMKGKTWGDFAYHFYIDVDGRIAEGRDAKFQGDSGTRYDMKEVLLVVLEGKFDEEKPTGAQVKSLDAVVAWLASTHKVDPKKISAHNDHTPTTCPGKNLKAYLPELRKKTAAALMGSDPAHRTAR
jgi:hypothetical protein